MNPTYKSPLAPVTKAVLALACVVVVIALALFIQNYEAKKHAAIETIKAPTLTEAELSLLRERMKSVPAPTLTSKQKADLGQQLSGMPAPTLSEEQMTILKEQLRAGQ